jgi:hypothetical protein
MCLHGARFRALWLGQPRGAAGGSLAERAYFYDTHVEVSVERGNVILSGLVFSDWDLRDAIRIASDAAKPHRVIDSLNIVEGGRH